MFSQSSSSPPAPTRRPATPTSRLLPPTPSPSTSKSCAGTGDTVVRRPTASKPLGRRTLHIQIPYTKNTGSPLVAGECGSIPQDLLIESLCGLPCADTAQAHDRPRRRRNRHAYRRKTQYATATIVAALTPAISRQYFAQLPSFIRWPDSLLSPRPKFAASVLTLPTRQTVVLFNSLVPAGTHTHKRTPQKYPIVHQTIALHRQGGENLPEPSAVMILRQIPPPPHKCPPLHTHKSSQKRNYTSHPHTKKNTHEHENTPTTNEPPRTNKRATLAVYFHETQQSKGSSKPE